MDFKSPRIMIAGTNSGSGKSTITMGILLALRRMGMEPQSFKAGPDYLDPMHHTLVLGKNCRNLDTWMFQDGVRDAFVRGSMDSKISIIEGVMGLYDGISGRDEIGSSAHLSKVLDVPVILVIDAKGMARSAGAIAKGFKEYDKEVNLAGVIFNRVGSERHVSMLRDSLDGIPFIGGIPKDDCMILESRHLGLIPAKETFDAERYERIADHVGSHIDMNLLMDIARSAKPIEHDLEPETRLSEKVRIGVARDKAFNFYYIHNIEALQRAGAEIVYFSPMTDDLPDVDGLYLGGGYPEIFSKELESNKTLRNRIRKASDDGMPIYAECGGLMYLCSSMMDIDGNDREMCNVFNAKATMENKRMTMGYVDAVCERDNVICERGWSTRGHEFHYSKVVVEGDPEYAFRCVKGNGISEGKDGLLRGNTVGGYLHLHFASNPKIPVRFVDCCCKYRRS